MPGSTSRSTSAPLRHDVLAGPVPHLLRRDAAQARQLAERLPEPAEPVGSSGLSSSAIVSPMSSSRSTPSAFAILRSVPNTFMTSGMMPRVGRSKTSAGPPSRMTLVTISVTSSVGSTGTRTCRRSPSRSNAVRKSRMSEYG